MPQRKHKPEEIVAKLRQVDVLLSQGRPVAEKSQQWDEHVSQNRSICSTDSAALNM